MGLCREVLVVAELVAHGFDGGGRCRLRELQEKAQHRWSQRQQPLDETHGFSISAVTSQNTIFDRKLVWIIFCGTRTLGLDFGKQGPEPFQPSKRCWWQLFYFTLFSRVSGKKYKCYVFYDSLTGPTCGRCCLKRNVIENETSCCCCSLNSKQIQFLDIFEQVRFWKRLQTIPNNINWHKWIQWKTSCLVRFPLKHGNHILIEIIQLFLAWYESH